MWFRWVGVIFCSCPSFLPASVVAGPTIAPLTVSGVAPEGIIMDTSNHKLLAFDVEEHSGLEIDLPQGSQIEAAFYGSVDGRSGINVTRKALQIHKNQGKLCASNTLFGDPASKKRKRLIVEAWVPPDAATQYELRSTSAPSRASILASSNGGSAAPLRQIDSDLHGKSEDCKASTPRSNTDADILEIVLEEHTKKVLSLPKHAVIVWAFYGDFANNNGRDVTMRVLELRAQNAEITATNKLFRDPCRHARKFLTVQYKLQCSNNAPTYE